MSEKLTEPMPPTELDPAPLAKLAGDWRDDDADVYEDDFEAADHGPVKATGVAHPVEKIKPVTRFLSRTVTVGTVAGSLSDPVMIFPPDKNRRKLTVSIIASAALVRFRIGSGKSECYNGDEFTAVNNVPVSLDLDVHTGALWAYCTDAANSVTLTALAVTE